ncbi:hypothetical protein BROC_01301 [Candidatus Brocadiaceae bacterium]|nr:hypothetical protein BROC_01301 [Candidatus Brocadiaceae bacterium]
MIGKRIEKLRKIKGMSRRGLEEATGIRDTTWQSVEIGRQNANEEHIKAISTLWPEYKMWLVFGETYPEIGQISPEIEEIRQNLKEA